MINRLILPLVRFLARDGGSNYRQNRIVYFHLFALFAYAVYALTLVVASRGGYGREGALAVCLSMLVGGNLFFTAYILTGKPEKNLHIALARVQVGYGILTTAVATYQYPDLADIFGIIFAGVYAWGLLRFHTRDFLVFGFATCLAYLSLLAYIRHEAGEPWNLGDSARAVSFSFLILWIGFLGGWASELRSRLRQLNHQLLAGDGGGDALAPIPPAASLRDRIAREIALVATGKAPFVVAALRLDDGHVIPHHGVDPATAAMRVRDILRDFVRARLRVSDEVWLVAAEPAGLLLVLFARSTVATADESLRRIAQQAKRVTVLPPGLGAPCGLSLSYALAAFQYGETPDDLIERAIDLLDTRAVRGG